MSIFWIVVIVVGYVLIAGIVAGVVAQMGNYDGYLLNNDIASGVVVGIFWPAIIVMLPIYGICALPFKLGRWIVLRFRKGEK